MAAQKGLDMILSIHDSGSTYNPVAGLRSTSITLNDESLDIPTKQVKVIDSYLQVRV